MTSWTAEVGRHRPARRLWVALVVRSRTFPPARVLLVLTSQHALFVSLGRRAGMQKIEETPL